MVPAVVATMDTACAAAAAAKPDIAKALAQEMSDPVAWAKLVNWLAPGWYLLAALQMCIVHIWTLQFIMGSHMTHILSGVY